MHPEDIDKLFREKLADHAPTPPAFLWTEIEAEIQPRKRRPVMWLAAASVALLALLGGLWWTLQNGSGLRNGDAGLAVTAPRSASAQAPENISPAQATPSLTSPSSPSEAPATEPTAAVATAAPATKTPSVGVQPDLVLVARRPSRPRASAQRQDVAQATLEPAAPRQLPSTPEPLAPEQALAQAPTELPARTVAATGPIEVEVRPAAAPAAPVVPARRPRLVSLLRQARNVVQGEKVSLTAAGLPETVTVQARVAGHTLTKVIQL